VQGETDVQIILLETYVTTTARMIQRESYTLNILLLPQLISGPSEPTARRHNVVVDYPIYSIRVRGFVGEGTAIPSCHLCGMAQHTLQEGYSIHRCAHPAYYVGIHSMHLVHKPCDTLGRRGAGLVAVPYCL
jgi:hypothetical protein